MPELVTPLRPKAKMIVGTVVSDKMEKTVVVAVLSRKQHRLYGKTLKRTTRYKAHDPNDVCKLGDLVRLVETRPLSKEKRWRVQEILQHKEVAEIQPSVIGAEVEGRIEATEDEAETPSPAATETIAAETTAPATTETTPAEPKVESAEASL